MTSDSRVSPADRTGVANGTSDSNGGNREGARHFRHIDDITRVPVEINPKTPINTLYTSAERHLKQAQSFKTFERIDLALEEYVIGLEYLGALGRHPGCQLLKVDNKPLLENVTRLVEQVKAQDSEFTQIKADIKADNAITGVQPGGRGSEAGQSASHNGSAKESEDKMGNGHDARQAINPRPVVQAKPEALHENALGSAARREVPASSPSTISPEVAAKATELLKARLAELKLPTTTVQDPRIRTRPILATQFSGQSDGRPSLAADGELPGLPKMPDAIYNPARGTVSSEASKLPSSTTGRFSMTRSTPLKSPPSNGTGSPRYSIDSNMATNETSKRTKVAGPGLDAEIPTSGVISVHILRKLLEEKKLAVLLIDIRDRDKFDAYHIQSPATICIEPEVLVRPGLSASQISESMVLSPPTEQILFEKRAEHDVIVFYDQMSAKLTWSRKSYAEKAVMGLHDALIYFDDPEVDNYRRLKLLEGGMDAWVAAFGGTGAPRPQTTTASVRPWNAGPARRKSSAVMPLQDPAEVNKFTSRLSQGLVRSPGEYLQRRPETSGQSQQSMNDHGGVTGYGVTDNSYGLPQYGQSLTSFPPAPKRPAPAAARPSYSGLAHRDDDEGVARTSKTRSPGRRRRRDRKHLVGLRNIGNWCYANSSVQALYATPGFAEELLDDAGWLEEYKVPQKQNESIPNPQLMSRIVGQLFYWMTKGPNSTMEAKILMDYSRNINLRDFNGKLKRDESVLGSNRQQDAQEFFSFITDQIDDETNRHRDRRENAISIPDNDPRSPLHNAIKYWQKHSNICDSLVSKYFQGLVVRTGFCPGCQYKTTNIESFDMLTLNMPHNSQDTSLDALIRQEYHSDIPEGYTCAGCHSTTSGYCKEACFGRFPDRLAIHFARATDPEVKTKDRRKISFPFHNLDLSNFFIKPEDRGLDGTDPDLPNVGALARDRHVQAPFVYDCYAVVCHDGRTINSGHYRAFTRNDSSHDPTDWLEYNDDLVTKIKVTGTGGREDWAERIIKDKDRNSTAYMVFYERKGTA